MRFIYLALFFFSFFNLSSQNTPVITKVTATWCPNCGAWAWDFMEAMKEDFQTGPAIVLGAHFQGSDIECDASIWFANNLKASSRPVFYLNNDRISVGGNWQPVSDDMPAMIEDINSAITAEVGYNSVLLEQGVINVTAEVKSIPTTNNKLYIGTYVFENNVKANQAQQGPNALHPNVIRASMTADMQGTQITSFGDYDFSLAVDDAWQEEELGIVTIIWEEDGDTYNILASNSATNISLLSSNDEVLDASNFTFRDADAMMIIEAGDSERYNLTLSDMSGQVVLQEAFTNEIAVDKTAMATGMYVATLRSAKGLLSQQVFVK